MKTGIVFEGGAFRTVFSCGVMDSFLDAGIMPDYIIGVSAGAAYGVSYASRQRERNLKIVKTFCNDKRYMGVRNLLNPKNRSYYGLEFAYETVPNVLIPFDKEEFQQYPGEFKAVVTNVMTGEAEYMDIDRDDAHYTLLKATCALPLLFPFIYMNGTPYLDGGLSDSIPFEQAFKDGCDRVVVVLTREEGYQKSTDSSTRRTARIYRKYPKLCEDLLLRAERYNQCLDKLKEYEKNGKVIVIRPDDTKGFGRLEKDLNKIQTLYDDGLKKGNDSIDKVHEFFI